MKELNPKAQKTKHDSTMALISARNSYPVIYNTPPWIVYQGDECYYLEYGNNGNWIFCQTTEQVQTYIPDFEP